MVDCWNETKLYEFRIMLDEKKNEYTSSVSEELQFLLLRRKLYEISTSKGVKSMNNSNKSS